MDKVAVVYWSGTGNTKAMADAIAQGLKEGGAEADVYEVSSAKVSDLAGYKKIAFGCPSMGAEVLEEGEFEPFFTEIEPSLSGKSVALFGSYGWGDGEWMRNWVSRTENTGASIMNGEGLIMQEAPDESECVAFGKQFAAY